MENKTKVFFHKPQPEDLWFREALRTDPGGADRFDLREEELLSRDGWEDWHGRWVKNPGKCFYRLVATGKSRSFVGEASWHYDDGRQIFLAEVVVMGKCRGQGYGSRALEMLCDEARKAGIRALHYEAAEEDPGVGWSLRHGFREVSRTAETVLVIRKL